MWLKEEVFEKLERNPHGVILVAEPGFGKSAFVADLIKNYHRKNHLPLLGHHICQYDSPSSVAASTFVSYLSMRLKCKNQGYANFLRYNMSIDTKEQIENMCQKDSMQCFDDLIRYPLSSLDQKNDKKFLFIIDALDECKWIGFAMQRDISVSDLLMKKYRELSSNVQLLITSRNETPVLSRFNGMKTVNVFTDSIQNIHDMENFIRIKTMCKDPVVKSIAAKSNYNALIIEYFIAQASFECFGPHKVPGTIYEMYDMEFTRLYGNDFNGEYEYDRTFFEIFASNLISSNPLPLCAMKIMLSCSDPPEEYEFYRMLQRIRPHLVRVTTTYTNEEVIQYYHSSLRDWLLSRKGLPFYINSKRGHFIWAKYLHTRLTTNRTSSCKVVDEKVPGVFAADIDMNNVYESITLGMHIQNSTNSSIYNEVINGKFEVPIFEKRISKYDITLVMNQVGCACYLFDDYDLIRILTALVSKKDWTIEASLTAETGHLNSLRALIDSGSVNFHYNYFVLDTGRFRYEVRDENLLLEYETQEHIWRGINVKRLSERSVKQRETHLINLKKNGSFWTNDNRDCMTVFHSFVESGNIEGIEMLLSIDETLVFDKTKNGLDVFDLAIESENGDVFRLLEKYLKPKYKFWLLYYASLRGRNKSLLFLLRKVLKTDVQFVNQICSKQKLVFLLQSLATYLYRQI